MSNLPRNRPWLRYLGLSALVLVIVAIGVGGWMVYDGCFNVTSGRGESPCHFVLDPSCGAIRSRQGEMASFVGGIGGFTVSEPRTITVERRNIGCSHWWPAWLRMAGPGGTLEGVCGD